MDLKGVGFSFINDEPREVLYMAMLRIHLEYWDFVPKLGNNQNKTDFIFNLGHFQIDNLLEDKDPVLMGPKFLNPDLITNHHNYLDENK